MDDTSSGFEQVDIQGVPFGARNNLLFFYTNINDRPLVNVHVFDKAKKSQTDVFIYSGNGSILLEEGINLLPNHPYVSCQARMNDQLTQVLLNIESGKICPVGNEKHVGETGGVYTYYDSNRNKLACYDPGNLKNTLFLNPSCGFASSTNE